MIKSYDEMSVGKYDECMRIATEVQDEQERNLRILSVLTDKSEDELLSLPLSEFGLLMRQAAFLTEPPQEQKMCRHFHLGRWDLYPTQGVDKMVAGQFLDFQNLSKQEKPDTACILSCFLIPVGYKYNTGYDIVELQDTIRKSMPIAQAFSLSAFFLTYAYRWLKVIQIYSAILARRNRKRAKEIADQSQVLLRESGDGFLALMPLPRLHAILGSR